MVRINTRFISAIAIPIRRSDVSRGFSRDLREGSGEAILKRTALAFIRKHLTPAIPPAPLPASRINGTALRSDDGTLYSLSFIEKIRSNHDGIRPGTTLGKIFSSAAVSLPPTIDLNEDELKSLMQIAFNSHLIPFLLSVDARDFPPVMDQLSVEGAQAVFKALPKVAIESILKRKRKSAPDVAAFYRKLISTPNQAQRLKTFSDTALLIIFDALSGERPQFLQAIGFERQVKLFIRLGQRRHRAYFEALTSQEYQQHDRNALKEILLRQSKVVQDIFYRSLDEGGKTIIRGYGYKPSLSTVALFMIRIKYTFLAVFIRAFRFFLPRPAA